MDLEVEWREKDETNDEEKENGLFTRACSSIMSNFN